jgi:serine/threonine-protein kinase
MKEAVCLNGDPVALSGARRVDRVCDAFESAWLAGRRPPIEEFLTDVPEPERPALLRELVRVDVAYRRKQGETPEPRDYADRFPSLEPDWLAGEVGAVRTLGRYRLGGEIGRGGMGAVLRAYDPHLGRDLAVKVLLEREQGQPDLVRRFLEEARIGARLQHPGIVPVHELGEVPASGPGAPRPYFTMKLVEGRTLAALLAERRDPAQYRPRFLSVFEQVCQTLAYAHAHRVIHRDLKPANVMVGAFGEVQVMDWGLAKVLDRSGEEQAAAPAGEPGAGIAGEGDTARQSGTQTGQALGTLSHMPPEQARGEADRVDERSDVFGLGAILCEVLTGRPPFTGRDRDEVLAQAQACDHAETLAGLDACGADAELVRLARACLAPRPQDRPRDAGVVAREVSAYLASVADRVRAAGVEAARATARAAGERKARWLTAGLAAAVLLLGLAGGGAGLWWTWQRTEQERQRAEQERAVNGYLEEVAASLRAWKLAEARAALERAEGRVAGGAPAALLRRVQQIRDDLTLVDSLDRIRLHAATHVNGKFDFASADRHYAALFRERGLAADGEAPGAVADRIRGSAVRAQLVAALDDWALAAADSARRKWLLEVARRADPGAWGDRFRDPAVWRNRAALEQLAKEANVVELSPQLLTALGVALQNSGADAVPLWRAAQARHPADFWLNFHLGNALARSKAEEAVGYYRASLAVRPGTSAVHVNLGSALQAQGRLDEAIRAYRQALALDPMLTQAHNNLGNALFSTGRLDDAIQAYRRAIALDPKDARAHGNLGNALQVQGRVDDAIREYRRAIALDPKDARAHGNLGVALQAKGQLDEAIQAYRRALALDAKDARAHHNLANALGAQGRVDEAIREYRRAIELDPKREGVLVGLGNALAAKGLAAEAVQAYRTALKIDSPGRCGPALLGLASALGRLGKYPEAIRSYRSAFSLQPELAEHLGAGHRLAAARAAALAAADQGRDAGPLDEKEGAGLRRQALDWLRADLAAWTRVVDKGPPQDRRLARRALERWRKDPDLAGLREKDALAKLPQAERDACRRLWADVAALLERAGPNE